jgi:hypothetical protein
MEKLVQQYLFEYYYIDTSEVGNDGIYYKLNQNKWKSPHNYSLLLKEIETVFGIEEVLIKLFINDWAVLQKPDVDLEFYWTTFEDLIGFPIAQRIAAHTIGMDLVSVQPMDGPRGELLYMDFQYGIDPATGDSETVTATTVVGRQGPTNRNGRVYDEEIYRQSWGNIQQLYENQQNHIVGELDHPSDSVMERAIHKWSSLIGISSRKKED